MTFSLRLRLTILLSICIGASTAPARARAADLYPLSQVRAGQVAVAKSVFRGTKIESFRMEIIAVLPKYDGGRSVILGRVLDGPVVARQSGVIGGMSGSPVYIDGRLAGAIAFTWAFSKEPVAGITPIHDMLAAFGEQPSQSASPLQASASLPTPLRVGGSVIGRVEVSPTVPSAPDPPGVMTLAPLGGLAQASGFSARAVAALSEELAPFGLRIASGGAGPVESLRPPLVPGAALGARLIGGDFDLTALGTLTMVDGDRVLGFGHPLFQFGAVDLPMTGGYVYDILPSLYISNKIMSPTQVIGRINSDHQSAIAGIVGGRAAMVPVSIEVADAEMGRSRTFSVEVARMRELTPVLVAHSVLSAIDETRGRVARGTARVRVEIEAEGRRLVREDYDYSPRDAAAAAGPAVLEPVATLMDNPFGALGIDRIRVVVQTDGRQRTASIERVTVSQARAKAGDEVTFTATVRPYGQPPVEVPLTLRLPSDLPRGQVRVIVSSGADAEQARGLIGAPRPTPTTLDQLIERYLSRHISSDLVLQAALPRVGASLLGEDLPDLPRSAIEALGAVRPTDLRPMPSLAKVTAPTDWVLIGRQTLMLAVDSPITPPRLPPTPKPSPEEEDEEEETSFFGQPPGAVDLGLFGARVEVGQAPPTPPPPDRPETARALARPHETWTHSTAADYQEFKLENIALAGDGPLSLGLETRSLAAIPAAVVWSVAARDGLAHVGTGSAGKVYRVSDGGEVTEFFATGEMNVHALAFGPGGELYAATSPRGRLFRIQPDGSGEVAFQSGSTYLWALAVAPDGTIYAGGGAPARVYAVPPDGAARLLAELPAANALSLALEENGNLYAGTADAGVIFRIAPGGAVSAIAQVPGASVEGLALGADGALFASSSPGGEVYRLTPEGRPELYVETGQQTVFGLALLPGDVPVAATGPRGLVIRAARSRRPELLLRPEAGTATAITDVDGALYVATSGPAVLFKLGPEMAGSGWVESAPLDAQRAARWGRVTWAAEVPARTEVAVKTRSGDSPFPPDGWSAWVPTVSDSVASPPARHLQYRLALSTESPTATPVVHQVSVSHRPQNRPPVISLRSPTPGQRLSKGHEIRWQARDPDRDALTFRIDLSPDLGATWEEVAKSLREAKFDWDTAKQKDGRYLLRVTASDRLSAPDDPQSAEATHLVWVDNTPPALVLFRSSVRVDEERRVRVTGMATDDLSPIRSIEHRVGAGEWQSTAPTAVEAQITDISIVTEPLDPGKHTVEVRVFDAAGNMALDRVEAEVPVEPTVAEPAPEQAPVELAAPEPLAEEATESEE